ncbi:MAG: hypothetical protein Q9M14_02145 [Mariprofundaceae bacterium]|nr:hypothetical protein [Mariprofundaceae bacterium]
MKGGSWDDHGGVCRPAAHHTRPITLKHICNYSEHLKKHPVTVQIAAYFSDGTNSRRF